ncbi:MAG: hypothetical protein ACLUI7_08930 [Coprococcus sp.]
MDVVKEARATADDRIRTEDQDDNDRTIRTMTDRRTEGRNRKEKRLARIWDKTRLETFMTILK